MEALIEYLQNSPVIIFGMFIISILSGIITIIFGIIAIILGRKRFYNDFLSKKITLPVYVYLLIVFVVTLVVIFRPAIKDRPKPLQIIKGESFGVQRIIVDGKHFVNCKFRKTELAYRGEGGCRMSNCSLTYPVFTFNGPAASTISTLKNFYAIPVMRPLIENTFENIRKGKLPKAIPPSDAADS